jgi:demethylmenaquinone methyltransferase/2-methoxy-6-polyprenyl-1,4-benzoquinol methylase
MADDVDRLLEEQIRYYRARAPEYDQWWLREGRWDLGPEGNASWLAEIDRVAAALDAFAPRGHVLDIGAGTGVWTVRLAPHADRITALDPSPEALALNAEKLRGSAAAVAYIEADVFAWEPPERYDVVFFSFWLSHVPMARFDEFWSIVDAALEPGGRVFFLDNAHPRLQSRIFPGRMGTTDPKTGISHRLLNDGREFRAVKVFWEPADLQQGLAEIGWAITVHETEWAFIYGAGGRA